MKLLKQGMKVHMFHKYIAKTQYDVNETNTMLFIKIEISL